MVLEGSIRVLAGGLVTTFLARWPMVTVNWAKQGEGSWAWSRLKEECRSLQRAVGNREDRIDQYVVAKAWSQVKKRKRFGIFDFPMMKSKIN